MAILPRATARRRRSSSPALGTSAARFLGEFADLDTLPEANDFLRQDEYTPFEIESSHLPAMPI